MTKYSGANTNVVDFNVDVLDLKDRDRIDLSQFARAGYLMPGEYSLAVQINKSTMPERIIKFIAPDHDPDGSEACITHQIVSEFGLKSGLEDQLLWWNEGQCLDTRSLKGLVIRGDLGAGLLRINLPQAYMEYTADNWDPPSRWDEGISGGLFDYSFNAQTTHHNKEKKTDNYTVSGNGLAGINLGPWRLRADWQAYYKPNKQQNGHNDSDIQWSRYYVYRPLPSLRAKLMVGENYLTSNLFDSFRYLGASLDSDDNMLPPNLRGYAPEVVGIAKTNAKVTISQQGRVLYETIVAEGPFRIQDLNNAVNGQLDVNIQEQDGSVTSFQINTATIPYLTRPGMTRFKLSTGMPMDYKHNVNGPAFINGDFAWGVNNGWSLYGGVLAAEAYHSEAIGIGRDLLALGAISFDVTQSHAMLDDGGSKRGGSYRVSYSKRFDSTDSQVTFAGYRFSDRNFMNMPQFLSARYNKGKNDIINGGKELYTISFNQQLRKINSSAYFSYNHQTYWDRPNNDTYNISFSKYFDVGKLKNLSFNASAYRNIYNNNRDDGVYVGITVPMGRSGYVSYDTQLSRSNASNTVRFSDRLDDDTNYSIGTTVSQKGGSTSAYITHLGDRMEVSSTLNTQNSNYISFGTSLRGGFTATAKGAAFHRVNVPGGTRMLIDTAGVSDVPIQGYSATTRSNMFGKVVVSDVNSYYRNTITVNLDKLNDNVEASSSVVEGTMTEGAIGYRKFGMIAGMKRLATIKLADGSSPAFGATVLNKDDVQTGIISEEGKVWLSGIVPGESMSVNWSGHPQCYISLPTPLPEQNYNEMLLLPCVTNR